MAEAIRAKSWQSDIRQAALQIAMQMAGANGTRTIDDLISDATKIENYIIGMVSLKIPDSPPTTSTIASYTVAGLARDPF